MAIMRHTGTITSVTLVVAAMVTGLQPVEASHGNGHNVIEAGPLRIEFERLGIFSEQTVFVPAVETPSRKVGQAALVLATFDDPTGISPGGTVTIPMAAFGFNDACDIIETLPNAQDCKRIPGTIQNLHAVVPNSTPDEFVSCIHNQRLTVSMGPSTLFETSQLKEVVNGPCGSAGLVGHLDEGPNDCQEALPTVSPNKTVTGTVVNAEDRHDFFALQIQSDLVNKPLGVEITSLMRLDASIPTPAFLRVWAPSCSSILKEALPNGEVSDIATFVAVTPGFYPVEVFLGERGSAPIDDPVLAVSEEVQCLTVENQLQYWNCPGAADQYAFEAFACQDRPFTCTT